MEQCKNLLIRRFGENPDVTLRKLTLVFSHAAIAHYLSGPPGGRSPPLSKVRLADEDGGVYGSGASSTTDGGYRSHGDSTGNLDDVLDYYKYIARTKSEYSAQLILGQLYYQGTRAIPQDFELAFHFLKQVADQFFPTTPSSPGSGIGLFSNAATGATTSNNNAAQAAGQAAGLLGKMYRRGEYVKQDNRTALKWFVRGAELENPTALNGLGSMYLEGVVVQQDHEKAMSYFQKAAEQDNEDAQVNLAIQYLRMLQHIFLLPHFCTLFWLVIYRYSIIYLKYSIVQPRSKPSRSRYITSRLLPDRSICWRTTTLPRCMSLGPELLRHAKWLWL
ncbi:hypothetical protein BC938DRAFT_475775 [Jimgerdemannia flammicorona]|uniref:HCP-like protein n=1 Tax=Jimgerdemannia flammicorona TaxID=994334 RepID=A0A433QR88_9FUNG|nr:hypothetical protein BC938DRAFT_475775 [Jimgerdemannia flammicorona]